MMIAHKMLLIPRILLHTLVVVHALEHDLTEAVEVRDIHHLWVDELRHHGAGGRLVVNLDQALGLG